jgi:O-antigen ligase
MFVFLVLSMLMGGILGVGVSFGDLNQFARFTKFAFIYTVSVSVIHLSETTEKEIKQIYNLITICSVILAIIVFQQFFDIFGLNRHYVRYVAPTQHESLIGDYPWPRPVGMIGNPNEVAFLFVLGGLAASYRLIQGGGEIYAGATLANLAALALTLSRTGFVSFILGAGYLFVIQVFVRRDRSLGSRLKYLALPLGLLVAVITYVLANPVLYEAIGWRFMTLMEFQSTSSWQERLQSWQINIQLFWESPLIGVGPLRHAGISSAADNEWLLLVRSYGILGTVLLVIGMVWPHLKAQKNVLRVFITGVLFGTAVYMVPAAVFHSLSLMPLLLIILSAEDSTVRPLTLA